MPVTPTYPGVYIEEFPSGVHTITGVSTSITAFVGYTQKGAVDEAVHIFSFADFERAFGGLSVDSPLSYCVRDFFQNGGSEAYVVRVAHLAASARVTLLNASGAATGVLVISAISAGAWGNNLQIDIDYDTVNPADLFNLKVTEYVERNGDWVPGTTEVYRNLTLNSTDPHYAITALSASQLITAALAPGVAVAGRGTSQSRPLGGSDLVQLDVNHNRVAAAVNGQGPYEVTFAVPAVALPLSAANLQAALVAIADDIVTKINAAAGGNAIDHLPINLGDTTITFRSGANTDRSSIEFSNATTNSATRVLKLGVANGGSEVDGAAAFRPLPTGTTGTPQAATSRSGGAPNFAGVDPTHNKLAVSLNGASPFEITLTVPAASLAALASDIAAQINAAVGTTVVTGSVAGGSWLITSIDPARVWTIRFGDAAANGAAAVVQAGLANGGVDAPPASSSTSGALTFPINVASPLTFLVGVNGQAPVTATLPAGAYANVGALAPVVATAINNALGANAVTGSTNGASVVVTSSDPLRWAAIHITSADTNDAAALLRLGLDNGGSEDASIIIDVRKGGSATSLHTVRIPLWAFWTSPKGTFQPTSLDDVAVDIDAALRSLANTDAYLAGATARRIGTTIRILPGSDDPNDPNTSFVISGPAAAGLGFNAGNARNVARYAPGMGLTALAQIAGTTGHDGTAPTDLDLSGDEAGKTGLYALEDVDLFNLLVMPDATTGGGMMDVLTEAIAYCVRRRAFMIIDAPEQVATFQQAQTWSGTQASPLRSRNDALYFPRLREPDPMMSGIVRTFPAAGALAGIYARTDAERGVWKAPAGTNATLIGATGLSYTLTDGENGTLNPRALNCLRTFPIIGSVSWGARTGFGADAFADEYKYIPVRRLALFLEESLYRGTQWVVFEPNDEPLWAQIRLNVGAFMHSLFAQGAFRGQTPRDAYFVKCDKETTTANDQDLGRVNIVVGFAPLEPAEFVIIQIQQIAGQLQT